MAGVVKMTGPLAASERPTALSPLSFIYGAIVLQILGLVALFLGHDQARARIESDHPTWSATRISDEVLAHSVGTAVYVLLLVVLWLWAAGMVEAGQRRAPVAITGLAVIGAGGALRMLIDPAFPAGVRLVSGLGALLGAGAVVRLRYHHGADSPLPSTT